MKKLKIIIADNDRDYSERLFSALEHKYSNLDLTLADSSVFDKLLQKKVYDIALLDVTVFSSDINLKNVKLPLAFLDEDIDESVKLANNIGKYIVKYQNVEVMYKEILGYWADIAPPPAIKGNSQMICFYSPAGGTGKTSISCAAAEMIANRGNRVLYLNFENISSYGLFFNAKTGKGLDEIIYRLDKGINIALKISSLVKRSRAGVMFFDMFSNIMDVAEITNESMSSLLENIMTADICDYIIVDMDTPLKDMNSVIMDKADKIVLVETPDDVCKEKINRFFLQKSMFEDYFSKAAVIRNKANDSGGDSVTGLEVLSSVPEINSSGFSGIIENIVQNARIDIDRLLA
ncbi:MAG: AAA family ATPase [Oscillospiraceae bacterium]